MPASPVSFKDHERTNRVHRICVGCGQAILDQFILRVSPNLEWHAACLKCVECQMFLDENQTCFVREGAIFCKEDYQRLFGTRCDRCLSSFGKTDLVMRARNKLFHPDCFRCFQCDKQLVTGDEFAITNEKLFCREHHNLGFMDDSLKEDNNNNDFDDFTHYNNNNHVDDRKNHRAEDELDMDEEENIQKCDNDLSFASSTSLPLDSSGSRPATSITPNSDDLGRPHPNQQQASSSQTQHQQRRSRAGRVRTVLTEKQLSLLKSCYSANPRPDALMKEQLVEMTGLSPRVVRVWFQNKRCKDKKKMALKQSKEGRKFAYGQMHGVPMVASSPMRQSSSVMSNVSSSTSGVDPAVSTVGPQAHSVDIHTYEAPWKALCDFALNTDLDKLGPNTPGYHNIVSQMHGGGYDQYPPAPHPHVPHSLGMPPLGPDGGFGPDGHPALPPPHLTQQPLDSAGYTLTSLDASSPLSSEA